MQLGTVAYQNQPRRFDSMFKDLIDLLKSEVDTFCRNRKWVSQRRTNYAEALRNYYEAMRLEIDPYDRSYIFYNIGLIHTGNREHTKTLEYYFRALERTHSHPNLLIYGRDLSLRDR
uniref:Photosystem I assembly protein Ycf3 n=1 Tax=Kalanchoe fedtschenkoi TaxID=63787 RepID=A0A7N0U4C1_KALFE